ncbi:hypothetical protein EN828_15325 [Mesorhizobium sp. M2D.F.Ca.ET.185.01.1.1]|uniref:hypothetical protein n=2 Tax=Mesorhizobium TaxID=68287 RepID=UPI000FCABE51|nr:MULTISPECIES: hypothetical protein [unclassified Mesorhizobium]TGP49219.1 hypothetical protein EN873_30550 [bacterium M00.F.Ca.ET.230.01.1.1]TGP80312.1 hypothetical protein EN870_11650 [bacterium M00.F.Ca.ET.227.01.1.1]TGQ02760.1 hypothetical protein EN865_02215 [bacterium M00.F.Ca.ET.222.01.1.1]TGT74574.1 hypothetical protein EN802_12075 [bacterium M00.F.Ca.ET.159.01.1.1]TGT86824.1 hypothetical protein EN800_08965 [bacterium M00.F.Ca.ET.157.01.1.1]TGT97634.1 hypothetical protein EN806_489
MYLKNLISVAILVAAASPALSQEQFVRPFRGGQDGSAMIQSSYSMTLPAKDDQDAAAQQEAALRSFYKVAAGSCGMVVETVADSCEIVGMTTNANGRNRNFDGYGGSAVTVTGQITMKVKFKASLNKAAQ